MRLLLHGRAYRRASAPQRGPRGEGRRIPTKLHRGALAFLAVFLGTSHLALRAGGLGGAHAKAASESAPAASPEAWPSHTLAADHFWLLKLPGGQRLDASALL